MNRKVFATALGGIALGALALPAAAQVSKPIGLSIRAGIDFPTSSGAGTSWGAGLEFNLDSLTSEASGIGNGGHITISGDYIGNGSHHEIPVLLNFLGTTSSQVYYEVGAGLADTSGHNTSWNFAYRGGIGYNFSHSQTPLFLEADYFGNANSHYNAIGFYIGVRL